MPHGYCYVWTRRIVWLHVASDSLITLSHYCIPVCLARKSRNLTFKADRRTKLIPVVILTSSREGRDPVNSYHLRANSYVQKAVDFDQFRQGVKSRGWYRLAINHRPANHGPANHRPANHGPVRVRAARQGQ